MYFRMDCPLEFRALPHNIAMTNRGDCGIMRISGAAQINIGWRSMKQTDNTAIVLRYANYRDNDRMLTLFSPTRGRL